MIYLKFHHQVLFTFLCMGINFASLILSSFIFLLITFLKNHWSPYSHSPPSHFPLEIYKGQHEKVWGRSAWLILQGILSSVLHHFPLLGEEFLPVSFNLPVAFLCRRVPLPCRGYFLLLFYYLYLVHDCLEGTQKFLSIRRWTDG